MIYCLILERQRFQLRAYIYQARDILRGDRFSFSDPYLEINFDNYSGTSATLQDTSSPVWNQTIIIPNIWLYGENAFIEQYAKMKSIIAVLWDHDEVRS